MWAIYHKQKVGCWNLNNLEVNKITIENFGNADTLTLSGFCDCGCLDGTIIKISHENETILRITRRSKILHGDSIMIDQSSAKKQTFPLDPVVSFYLTSNHIKQLERQRMYRISITRVIDPKAQDIHIFDLELK